MDKLSALAEEYPQRGFDEFFGIIRHQGFIWNRKRVLRIYRVMKLGLRRKYKKRLPARVKESSQAPEQPNYTWSMDFMSDALGDGRKVRVFNVIDDFNREALAIEAGLSFPSRRVVRVLEWLKHERGLPSRIRVDNGPEFISWKFKSWCENHQIEVLYIQPGKPVKNTFIERFNRFFREDVLDAYWFEDLDQLKVLAEEFRLRYNSQHPHKSLGRLSPDGYYRRAVNSGRRCGGKIQPANPIHDFTTINSFKSSSNFEILSNFDPS